MTSWHTYGVALTDDASPEDIVETLEATGLHVYASRSGSVKATERGSTSVSTGTVKRALRSHHDEITGFIAVSANDTDDTASGQVYEVDGQSFEKGRTRRSGDPSSRRNWHGITFDGVRIDGGKY